VVWGLPSGGRRGEGLEKGYKGGKFPLHQHHLSHTTGTGGRDQEKREKRGNLNLTVNTDDRGQTPLPATNLWKVYSKKARTSGGPRKT